MSKQNILADIDKLRYLELSRRQKLIDDMCDNFLVYIGDIDSWRQSLICNQFLVEDKTKAKLLICYINDTYNGEVISSKLDEIDKLQALYRLTRNQDNTITTIKTDSSIKTLADKLNELYGITINYSRINNKWCYVEKLL